MKHKETTWGWMLAVDFFFAGMGGAMITLNGIMHLFFNNESASVLGAFVGPVFVAAGAGFLTLELGRPLQAWRVFMNPKSILTFGAWNMTLSIFCGFAFASFGIKDLPWADWFFARNILGALCVIVGLVVATYPGVLLARHKGRPFWTGPGIASLFLLSSLLTGLAAQDLLNLVFSRAAIFTGLFSGLLALQLVVWILYIYVKCTGTTTHEAEAARSWMNGPQSFGFLGIFLGLGSLGPLVLILLSNPVSTAAALILALMGGGWMRFMVVKSGEYRTWLPGEQRYLARLPKGDEAFLRILK